MISAGVKEVKNKLSQFLARVKGGEEVVITERGKPIARIVREQGADKSIRTALGPLVRKGMVVLPGRGVLKEDLRPIEVPGKSVSAMVAEDRR